MHPIVVGAIVVAGTQAAKSRNASVKRRRKTKRRKRNPDQPNLSTASSGQPHIVFGDQCSWSIPAVWWTAVALPRLRKYLRDVEGGAQRWPDRQAALSSAFNAKDAAYAILRNQTGECELPSKTVDLTSLPPTATQREQNAANLVAHINQNVAASVADYIASKGSRLTIPVAGTTP